MSGGRTRNRKIQYTDRKYDRLKHEIDQCAESNATFAAIRDSVEMPECGMPIGGSNCILQSGHRCACAPPAKPREVVVAKPKSHKWIIATEIISVCTNCGYERRVADTNTITNKPRSYSYLLIKNGIVLDNTTKAPKCV